MPTPNIDRNTYLTDSRFAQFRDKGISYESFSLNQSYYLNQLSKTSVMDLYNKGKAMYETYTNLYNQSNNLFIQLKNKEASNKVKYNQLLENFANNSKTGEASTAERNQAARESGYTAELIRSTNDAEIMTNVYLDGRRNAVSIQQRGLAQSVFDSLNS